MTDAERDLLLRLASLVNALLPQNTREDGLIGYRAFDRTDGMDLREVQRELDSLMKRIIQWRDAQSLD